MDLQTLFAVIDRLEGMQRRARNFGHDRDRIIDEIAFAIEDYRRQADRIETQMERECA